MIELHFLNDDAIIFIDGVKLTNSSIKLQPGTYSMLYHGNESIIFSKISVSSCEILASSNIEITKIKPCSYLVTFSSLKSGDSPQSEPYFQQELPLEKTHYITAYKLQSNYYITIETEDEIYSVLTATELKNIIVKSTPTNSGTLIMISGSLLAQSQVIILYYSDDYYPLIQCTCNKIEYKDNEVLITDKISDSYSRIVTRHFTFSENSYKEISRDFQYENKCKVIPQLIPYVFIESLFVNDLDACKELLSSNVDVNDTKNILGDFTKIVNIESFPYVENQLFLEYKEKSQNIIKCFDFSICNDLINKIESIEL